jgi:hypothetical protein
VSGHTPGPWVRDRRRVLVGANGDEVVVDDIDCGSDDPCSVHDAHLIAAAPDMLEAAEALIHRVAIPHDCPERIALVAAIKKARGEK